jgi:hypothetical protein
MQNIPFHWSILHLLYICNEFGLTRGRLTRGLSLCEPRGCGEGVSRKEHQKKCQLFVNIAKKDYLCKQ